MEPSLFNKVNFDFLRKVYYKSCLKVDLKSTKNKFQVDLCSKTV